MTNDSSSDMKCYADFSNWTEKLRSFEDIVIMEILWVGLFEKAV